jgi:hypothetical protein
VRTSYWTLPLCLLLWYVYCRNIFSLEREISVNWHLEM